MVVGQNTFRALPFMMFVGLLTGACGGNVTPDAGDPYSMLRNHAGCGLGGGWPDPDAGVNACGIDSISGAVCVAVSGFGQCKLLREIDNAEVQRYARNRTVMGVCLVAGQQLPRCGASAGGQTCLGELTCVGGVCVPLPCN